MKSHASPWRRRHRSRLRSAGLSVGLVVGAAAQAQDATTLAPVQVEASRETPMAIDRPNRTGSRLGLTPLQTPASIELIEGSTVRARGDSSVQQAASRATGITAAPAPGNGGTSLAARGFLGHGSVMQLYDGTRLYVGAGTVTFPFDTWNIERIEVLRGAASVMFGEGAIGGAVNVVPKKPTRGPIENEALLRAGSHGTRQIAFGSGGAIDERWSYRIDLSHRRGSGFMARGDSDSLAASAALRLDLTPRLHFTLSHDEGHQRPEPYYGVPLMFGRVDERLRRQNFNVGDALLHYRDRWTRLDTVWTPSDQLTVRNQLYRLDSRRHWRNSESYSVVPATGRVSRSDYLEIGHDQTQVGNRTDLTHRHTLAGMANQLVVGLDFNRIDFLHANDSPYGGRSVVHPFFFDPGRYVSPVAYLPRYRTRTSSQALFAEDRLAINAQWSVVGSLRWDHARLRRTDLQSAANGFERSFSYGTGRLGVVYAPDAAQSFYAQVARAVDPLGSLITTSAAQSQFDLTTGRQVEVGYKRLLADGRGAWTVAAYRIEKRKLLSRDANDPTVTQQIGQQSSEGIEATLDLMLTPTLRLEANLARLRARYDDFNEQVGKTLVSRAGNVPAGVPQAAANLWLNWQFAPQWEAGLGLRYVGPRQVDAANTRRIGGYAVADATLAWEPNPRLRLTLQAFNLGNRVYPLAFSNGGNQWILGRPRALELSALVRF